MTSDATTIVKETRVVDIQKMFLGTGGGVIGSSILALLVGGLVLWAMDIIHGQICFSVIIGFTLTLVHLIGIPLTGTSVNPARSLATALNALIFDGTTDALAQVWMFIVAPLAGAALAAVLYKVLNTEKDAE